MKICDKKLRLTAKDIFIKSGSDMWASKNYLRNMRIYITDERIRFGPKTSDSICLSNMHDICMADLYKFPEDCPK